MKTSLNSYIKNTST